MESIYKESCSRAKEGRAKGEFCEDMVSNGGVEQQFWRKKEHGRRK